MVEVIRNIAEYAIYSERFNRTFMDTLIEHNLFHNFELILKMNISVI